MGMSTRSAVGMFAWFFAALSMVALLSPPGATHDEWYHVSSIWCGQGEREPFCLERFPETATALINLDLTNCQINQEALLLCPIDRAGESQPVTNFGQYPKLFYFTLSWFVVPWAENSVAVTRVASAFFISLVLALLARLLPSRYRLVLVMVILSTFSTTGYFLFASINPSSWAAFGVGVGWLGLHAALSPGTTPNKQRIALAAVGLTACIMAAGSRWDAPAFLALVGSLSAVHLLWLHFPAARFKVAAAALSVPVALFAMLEWLTPFKPLASLRRLYTYPEGEPDNVAFFSHYLLGGLTNSLGALGSVPTMSGILLPEILYITGLLLLGWFVAHSTNLRERLQIIGALVTAATISLVIMAQVALVDNRDAFGVEPRYSYPLLIFLVGWWFLLGPDNLADRITKFLKPAAVVATVMFAIGMFTVAERFVDVQTYGLRLLPEGPEQWWWSWMPVGPNVVVVVAVFSLWMFLRRLLASVAQPVATSSTS